MAEYDYLVLYLPRGTTRDAARRILTDHAEYGPGNSPGSGCLPTAAGRLPSAVASYAPL